MTAQERARPSSTSSEPANQKQHTSNSATRAANREQQEQQTTTTQYKEETTTTETTEDHERKGREQEREREEQGRERGTDDENHVPQKHKKRRSIKKKCLVHIENSKKLRFPVRKGANCETPFLAFLQNFVNKKTAISGIIRLIFEAD